MYPDANSVESFLSELHDLHPGLTSRAFADLPVQLGGQTYQSSYAALAAIVPLVPDSSAVLDLACGDGFLLSVLASRRQPGLRLFGVDLSAGELSEARRRTGVALLSQGRGQAMPFASAAFDFVLCHLALMLMDDVEQVLADIRRVLKPSGRLAGIVGIAGPSSAVWEAYWQAFSGVPKQDRWSTLRLIDARWRSSEGIAELLAPGFCDIESVEIHCAQRLSPEELWQWFQNMYDLYLLDERERPAVKTKLMALIAPLCEVDGKLELRQKLLRFSARVR